MAHTFDTISNRLLSKYGIDINKYIYFESDGAGNRKSTLKEGPTTLEGIEFVCQNEPIGDRAPDVGIQDLSNALHRESNAGRRAFAGQIHRKDLDHKLLQASFSQTDGRGFREIYHLSQRPGLARHPGVANVMDEDSRAFDAKFGEMIGTVDISSLHAALLGPLSTPVMPGQQDIPRPDRHFQVNKQVSSFHLDKKGFVFADPGGKIYISMDAIQHTGDELGIKDKWLDGTSPLSFFAYTELNTIEKHERWSMDPQTNGYLRLRSPRGVLGLELKGGSKNLELFLRGSLGINVDTIMKPELPPYAGVVGLRARF